MPTYEYVCEACENNWDEDQKITDPKITTCPKCNKETAKRLISGGTQFQLKGGGWYKDGYSNKN